MIFVFAAWHFLLSVSLGSFSLNLFRFQFKSNLEKLVFSFALGFGLLGYVVLDVGLTGFLYREVLLSVLGILSLFLIKEEIFWLKELAALPGRLISLRGEDPKVFWLIAASLLVFLLALAQSLLPPTAHDALCYHLYIPKRFVQEHRIAYLPYLVNSLFPFLMEMHYTVALLFGQTELVNVFHAFAGFGTFLGIVALARRFMDLLESLIAGLLFILTPGIFNQSIVAYNDVGLSWFTLCAVASLIKISEGEWRGRGYALMGIFSGLALSVKYLALFHVAILFVLLGGLWAFREIRGRDLCKGIFLYAVFTLAFSFVWYLRSYLHEGNPVYPFFPTVFGGAGKEYSFERAGFGKSGLDLVLVGWRIVMFPAAFGGTPVQLGSGFLIFLPLIFFLRYKERSLRILGSFLTFFFIVWFYTVQNARFLFPALALLSLLIALASRPFRIWVFLILLMNAGFALYHGKEGYAYLLRQESRSSYLSRTERTYLLSEWMNQHLSRGSKVLSVGEVRLFYFDPEMVRERVFRRKTRYDRAARSAAEVLKLFKKEEITHLLVAEGERKDDERLPPFAVRNLLSDQAFRSRHLRLLYEEDHLERGRYEVYEIIYPADQ